MKFVTKVSLLTILSANCLSYAHAATVHLIDFNDPAGDSRPSGTWNEYNDPTDINGSVIKDSTDTFSAITLSVSGTITNSTNSGTAVFTNETGGPSWVTTGGVLLSTGAAGDYFFTSTGSVTSFTLTYANLNEGDTVSLDLWNSRNGSGNGLGNYSYSIDGTNWFGFNVLEKDGSASTANGTESIAWNTTDTLGQAYNSEADGNVGARYMNVSTVTIGDAGTLLVKAADYGDNSGRWASIGAMRLTVIPEPSSYALISGFLALGYLTARRRKA